MTLKLYPDVSFFVPFSRGSAFYGPYGQYTLVLGTGDLSSHLFLHSFNPIPTGPPELHERPGLVAQHLFVGCSGGCGWLRFGIWGWGRREVIMKEGEPI